ncbi:hypothetical protein AAFN88_19295 [Pelagibius sp. CAU 1746]|uniref:hypothetical protein n=1 Tax=Pelagibius sp. CAU 1746 TaxID=3140370 RepID=UPI00325BEF2E
MPAAVLGAALLVTPPLAQAEDLRQEESPKDTPGEMAREGLEQMMQALRLLVESIPQYELPEVLENGDIIIRRKHPKPESQEPEFDETAT